MSIKVNVGPLLQEYSDIPGNLEVNGSTVGQCLDDLIRQYPESRNWLFDEGGLLRVVISINNIETVTLDKEGLDRILKAGDELQIFAVVSGG
ncbi:MAG: MoaD/ThiS family protein [Dehalococcoidales bacterium]|nr:MAG: MoaD/ThiS family protein [Dehalococcoidales bacterium]